MSIFGNLSDLAHEIRSGVGTVLTILGSKLEADARARVECGPQWLTEFEEQRDSLEPADMCPFHGEWCAGEASWCTRQCNKCDEAVYWHRDVEAWFHCAGVLDRRPCPYGDGPVVEHSSAAVSAAADGAADRKAASPTPVGVEGRGEDSDILCSASPRRSTDPGAVSTPAPREQVTEDDLAAHIMGDFVSGQEVDPLTATLIDALSSRIARCLLADFHITRK